MTHSTWKARWLAHNGLWIILTFLLGLFATGLWMYIIQQGDCRSRHCARRDRETRVVGGACICVEVPQP